MDLALGSVPHLEYATASLSMRMKGSSEEAWNSSTLQATPPVVDPLGPEADVDVVLSVVGVADAALYGSLARVARKDPSGLTARHICMCACVCGRGGGGGCRARIKGKDGRSLQGDCCFDPSASHGMSTCWFYLCCMQLMQPLCAPAVYSPSRPSQLHPTCACAISWAHPCTCLAASHLDVPHAR